MKTQLRANFQRFLNTQSYCTPPGRAACALNSARVLERWQEMESADLVRLRAEDEQENYFDVYGKPDNEREEKQIRETIERDGCYCVLSEYWADGHWHMADCVGMCVYRRPLDPFDNDYVIQLMAAAIEQIPQNGEHDSVAA